MRLDYIILFLLLVTISRISGQEVFTSFEGFMAFASENSTSIKNGNIELTKNKREKLSAIYGLFEPEGGLTGTYTNNTQLPVTLFPAEVLGGEPGEFQELQFGIQYQTDIQAYVEVKLLNLPGWKGLKLNNLNIEATEINNKMTLRNLFENSAVIYYNIETLQEQLKATEANAVVADSLYTITVNRYEQGLIKQQDVNDSEVNYLEEMETADQIKYMIEEQYIALKLLCDIPEDKIFKIESGISENNVTVERLTEEVSIENNPLETQHAKLSEDIALQDFRKAKSVFAPTLSFFASQLEQQFNENSTLFDSDVDFIGSTYIGFRLRIPIPSSRDISNSTRAKFEYQKAINKREEAELQENLNTQQLSTNYKKAFSQSLSKAKIYELQKNSYQKYFLNYQEGVAELDDTLASFKSMINSQYNLIAAKIERSLWETKIMINNTIK